MERIDLAALANACPILCSPQENSDERLEQGYPYSLENGYYALFMPSEYQNNWGRMNIAHTSDTDRAVIYRADCKDAETGVAQWHCDTSGSTSYAPYSA